MTTLPNMGLTLPTRGAPGAGQWGDTLDANLQLEDAHDHTPGKGARITSAALNINADVSWSSLFAPTSLHRVQFSSVAALSSNAQNKSLFVADGTGGLTANELYWRNNTGNNVKLTSGNALNISFVGGIGGDYTAVGAALNFDDSVKRYTHKDGSGNWARIASGEIRLIETGTTEAVFVGHQAPSALAASYTVTWPLAVPAHTGDVRMSSAGVLTVGGTQTLSLPGTAATGVGTGVAYDIFTANSGSIGATGGATFRWGIPLRVGWNITSLTFNAAGDGAVDLTTVDVRLYRSSTGVASSIGSTTVTNVSGTASDRTVDVTDTLLIDGDAITFKIIANAGNIEIFNVRVTFDQLP